MRPKRITVLVIALAIMGALQFAGSVQAMLVSLGIAENPAAELSADNPQDELLGAAAKSVDALTPASAAVGLIGSLLFLVCLVGFWRMRKWAVILFAATTAVGVIISFAWRPDWVLTHPTRPWISLILPAIIFAIVLPSWRDMTPSSASKPSGQGPTQSP